LTSSELRFYYCFERLVIVVCEPCNFTGKCVDTEPCSLAINIDATHDTVWMDLKRGSFPRKDFISVEESKKLNFGMRVSLKENYAHFV